jgi:hypothetical protein
MTAIMCLSLSCRSHRRASLWVDTECPIELSLLLTRFLRRSPEAFVREMGLAAPTHWYRRGQISQEHAAQLACLDRTDFLAALAREGVNVFSLDEESLKRELERG